jgi:hypothetical protein
MSGKTGMSFEQRAEELIEGDGLLQGAPRSLLTVLRSIGEQVAVLDFANKKLFFGVASASFRHPGRGTEMEVGVWGPADWLVSPFSPQPSAAHICCRAASGGADRCDGLGTALPASE